MVETTPRVRAVHPGWTLAAMKTVIQRCERVRIGCFWTPSILINRKNQGNALGNSSSDED
ncbi:MAG: hypothetical protein M1157_04475 [Deinococcus sp.]|nr:hypothetical protein [Deinococcus sp.]